jgi:hypothetical protein
MAKLTGSSAGEPVRSQHTLFGDLAAVWSMLERLNLAGVVDEIVPRRSDAAASVGTYIALATANRVVAPCSKAAFAEWWASIAGPRWVKLGEGALDHRRFWKAMDPYPGDRPDVSQFLSSTNSCPATGISPHRSSR